MIRRTVSAALLLRDAFTGQTFSSGSSMHCLLDGRPLQRPIWKREGYLVLTDLAPGEHVLRVCRSGYRDELIRFTAEDGAPLEDTISLKPGKGYRFPPETVRVSLSLLRGGKPAPCERLWLGQQLRSRLRLAQEKAEAGDELVRVFCEGNVSQLPIPGHFLLTDKTPELVYLRSVHGETAAFAPALTLAHVRGTQFVPMQSYETDDTGMLQVLLREPGTLFGFCGGKVFEAGLSAGGQDLTWKLEG